MSEVVWRKCSSCKKGIPVQSTYYVCSVSSCSRKSAPVQFCTFDCWSVHNEVYNHRNAAAIEERAPGSPDPAVESPAPQTVTRTAKSTTLSTPMPVAVKNDDVQTDILVVVSKVKKYIQDRSELNTAGDVAPALTKLITRVCDVAAANAVADGRKTVMARDLPQIKL